MSANNRQINKYKYIVIAKYQHKQYKKKKIMKKWKRKVGIELKLPKLYSLP